MMTFAPRILLTAALLPLIGAAPSCRDRDAHGTSNASTARPAITPVTVEVRSDGLAYLPRAAVPFTGAAVTPHPDAPWLIKRQEPYTHGKLHGEVLELYKNGRPKTLRRYSMGVPEYAATYHLNGQQKIEMNLNANDKGEGPYKRWYDNGQLEATSGLDAEERWHGEFKEWTPTGVLKSHHLFENGQLRQIVFESPASREARIAAGVEVQPAPPPATPATPAVSN